MAIIKATLSVLAFVLAWPAFADAGSDLKVRLEAAIKKSGIPERQLGLAVFDADLEPPRLLFGLNEQGDFVPASTTKIATAAAVLLEMGSSHKFLTTLSSEGKIAGEVLKGDLYLKGGGDAGFVSESMWFLVNEFVRTGVRKIEGDIVVDDTEFDSVRTDPSRDPERADRAYDAPVGAMSFNWNSINIFVRPSAAGQPPRVHLDPIPNGFKVVNKAQTVGGSALSISVARRNRTIEVSGRIGVNRDEFVAYKNIDDPDAWSGRNLVFFLEQRGISVTGKVRTGRRPARAAQLAKAESRPVSQHVADMMKFSNNYVAEMLTKNLAVKGGQVPGNMEKGMAMIRDRLQSLGVDKSRFVLLNPSGLSRRNRMKPYDLGLLLLRAQEDFPTFAEMLSSFPLAGIDGTLKNRMKGTPAQGWVRGKTGLLHGVAGMAGYAGRKDGSVRAFAFLFNGAAKDGDTARRLFDAMAAELVQ